jgi:nucleotidyltransferase substrate binding protein (TIGR01987 family)
MTNENKGIRWLQRYANFSKAFEQLSRFIDKGELNEFEEQGLIKAFEYTYELSWKTLQDLLYEKGYQDIAGPKPVIQQSFQDGYIQYGEGWMKMHNSRNLTSHSYNEETAHEIATAIVQEYFELFRELNEKLKAERHGQQGNLFDEQ